MEIFQTIEKDNDENSLIELSKIMKIISNILRNNF